MPEQQPTNKCPYCGYPVEIGEHAPDCPNLGKSVEVEEEANEATEIKGETTAAEVLETLSPEKITDQEGIERDIYTFKTNDSKDVKVIFYSPEELPYSEEMVQERQGFVIGDKPKIRKEEEWSRFVENVRSGSEKDVSPTIESSPNMSEARAEGKLSFFVENSPRALLDLAFQLGVEDDKLRELRKKMAHKEMNDEGEEMMDKVIAGKVIDDKGEFRPERNTDGEALMLLALQGDKQAETILQQRLEQMKKKDEEREKLQMEELHKEPEEGSFVSGEAEPLDVDKLVAVHATRYKPKPDADSLNIQTTFDGTGWDTPRNTVHFSMNHHVTGHMSGNWMDTPYVALSPLKDVIEKNGKPMGINTVDTYFELSPGRKLALPKENARLIMPGKIEPSELFQYEDNGNISYQSEKINEKDVEALFERYGKQIEDIEADIWEDLENTLRFPPEDDDFGKKYDWEQRSQLAHELRSYLSDQTKDKETIIHIMDLLKTKSTSEVVESIIQSAGLSEKIPKEYLDRVKGSVDGTIRNHIKQIAVKDAIEKMGFENHRGGMWAWDGDSMEATKQAGALAKKMGTDWGAHSGHPTSEITQNYYHEMGMLKDGEQNIKDYRKRVSKMNGEYFDQMTPAIRRMLYLRGLI